MNIKVEKQANTEQIKVNRHREVARASARRRYKEIRTNKWHEALEYLLTLEGEIDDIAPMMADKYNISKVKY